LPSGFEPGGLNGTDNIRLYPNPTPSGAGFRIGLADKWVGTPVTIEIFDVTGRIISSQKVDALLPDSVYDSPRSSGVYFVRVLTSTTTLTPERLVVY
jgi:hypothetical protein